ncbi:acyl-homoserine-lactone synthase [Chromobacterium vaccinii]|uniref:Acyl-homoserine-lactone synthase n=1 Tax=Chromobacterium vaccinii TaxID=1108595 RepID=A0ABV0F9C4_9NEIS
MEKFFALESEGMILDRVHARDVMNELMSFRHRVFRDRLKWLPASPDGLDWDEYDAFSANLAITRAGDVVGSVRFTPGSERYMLERDFSTLLVAGEKLRKGGDSAEISRFAMDTGKLSGVERSAASRLLYFALWQWASWNDIRWMYFVVEPCMYRRLVSLGLPVRPLGIPRPLGGGVLSMAGCFDWSEMNPEVIRSLRLRIASDAFQEQSHAFDYSH